jgi:hypothetical protein
MLKRCRKCGCRPHVNLRYCLQCGKKLPTRKGGKRKTPFGHVFEKETIKRLAKQIEEVEDERILKELTGDTTGEAGRVSWQGSLMLDNDYVMYRNMPFWKVLRDKFIPAGVQMPTVSPYLYFAQYRIRDYQLWMERLFFFDPIEEEPPPEWRKQKLLAPFITRRFIPPDYRNRVQTNQWYWELLDTDGGIGQVVPIEGMSLQMVKGFNEVLWQEQKVTLHWTGTGHLNRIEEQ